jgi:hypothetical protein
LIGNQIYQALLSWKLNIGSTLVFSTLIPPAQLILVSFSGAARPAFKSSLAGNFFN